MKRVVDIEAIRVPKGPIDTKTYVIAGGPCSGKTTLLKALASRGYVVEFEPAEELLRQGIAQGQSVQDVRRDPIAWQERVVRADMSLFESISPDNLTFVDTSLIETLVFCRRVGIEFGSHLQAYVRRVRFAGVFFLEPLERYESTAVRMEDQSTSHGLGAEILETYDEFGYRPHRLAHVPSAPSDDRIDQLLKMLPSEKTN
jgi:predicted ATPase